MLKVVIYLGNVNRFVFKLTLIQKGRELDAEPQVTDWITNEVIEKKFVETSFNPIHQGRLLEKTVRTDNYV